MFGSLPSTRRGSGCNGTGVSGVETGLGGLPVETIFAEGGGEAEVVDGVR